MIIPAAHFANPDPAVRFTTPQDLVTVLNSLAEDGSVSDVVSYVKGSTTPAVDDQDKLWVRTESVTEKPIALYTFSGGVWVRVPPDPGSLIGLYAGDPSVDFDSTGKGLKGAGTVTLDFYGWALMNGDNGTANLSDRFIVGAKMDNLILGYDSGWRSTVTGSATATGGALNGGQKYTATGASQDDTGLLFGEGIPVPADDFNNIPPFFALAYIQFINYGY